MTTPGYEILSIAMMHIIITVTIIFLDLPFIVQYAHLGKMSRGNV